MVESVISLESYAVAPAEVTEGSPTKQWEEYVSDYATVMEVGDSSNWAMGDIACEVTRAFGNTKDTNGNTPLDKFAQELGQRKETVRQYAWVSRAFPKREDRKTSLSWSHYRAAAKAENPMLWIDEAVKNDWSVAKLAEEVKNVADATAAASGQPCSHCENPLPENGAYHIRQDGQVVARFCSCRCGMAWFHGKVKNEMSQLSAA